MRKMAAQLGTGDTTVLETFGILLQDHTRLEERKLFPIAETQLSTDQFDRILQATQPLS